MTLANQAGGGSPRVGSLPALKDARNLLFVDDLDSESDPCLWRSYWQNKRRALAVVSALVAMTLLLSIPIAYTNGKASQLQAGENRNRSLKRRQEQAARFHGEGLASGDYGAVAADAEACSHIGVEVLKENGSAVDAAIAAGLCVGVINSFTSGIGGGGFMLIRSPNGTAEFIDFRERAPAAATECMFCADPKKSLYNGLAVAIPGELAGYEVAHSRYGRLPWARLIEPSINLCEKGFRVSEELYSRMMDNKFLFDTPGFREIFTMDTPNGRVLRPVGSFITWPNLGKTLRAVAERGAEAFYTGELARSIVQTVVAKGGIITIKDMANRENRVVVRKPLEGLYRGRKVYTAPPPASGAILLQMLNILEGYDPARDLANVTAIRELEASKWGFAARTELADADFVPGMSSRVAEIIDKTQAAKIRAEIRDVCSADRTFPAGHYRAKYDTIESPGTTHISAVDKDDMSVSLTSTINLEFGSRLMDPETGVILNNGTYASDGWKTTPAARLLGFLVLIVSPLNHLFSEMDDFSSPDITNYFGLRPSKNNFIRPMKRPLSSSAPTILELDGRFEAAVGASGGSRIITAVLQVVLNMIDRGMDPYAAVTASRWHHQLLPETAEIDSFFPQSLVDALIGAGHNIEIQEPGVKTSVVQVVQRLQNGTVLAASDPRKRGRSAAY